MKPITILLTVLLISGCANPLNRVTYDRYWKEGGDAEHAGQLGVAEQAYYRALVNVDMGNLGPLLKAQALYNLGCVKRRVRKYAEAEDLLKQSLALDEKILSSDDLDTDRCRIELCVVFAAQAKWVDGSRYLEQVLPHVSRFSGHEREFTLAAFKHYSEELRKIGQEERAKVFEQPDIL
ncbi:MAG: tetratricopeptide repeat protein [Opitutales bacterium]